jgi:hypothetical protein
VNPLLLPPRLVLRALDDLHTIARAAAALEDIEARINERLVAVIELGERIAEIGEGIDDRFEEILALGERIVALGARVDDLVALGDRVDQIDARAVEVLATGDRVEQAARDVAASGRLIADALPVLQRAITMAEPLEGAVERLGRIVDRLPGGARPRGGTTA